MFSVRMALSFLKKKYLDVFSRTVMSYCLGYIQTSVYYYYGYELLPGIYIQTSVYFIFFNFCQFPRRKMHCGF